MFCRAGWKSFYVCCGYFLAATVLLSNVAVGKNYNDGRSNTAARYSSDSLPGNGLVWDGEQSQVYRPPGRAIREQGVQITTSLGASPTPTPGGGWHVDSFFDITYAIDFSVDDGPDQHLTGSGIGHIVGDAPAGSGPTRTFDTEMLSMNLSGQFSLAPNDNWQMRESPTLPSLGQMSITDLGGGEFRIESFFDVFTELTIDGGASWSVGQPVPEPTSLALAALGLGLVFARRR